MNRDSTTQEFPGAVSSGDVFLPQDFEALLEQLAYACQFTGGIQVVEGPEASGKSVLAQLFYEGYLTQCQQAALVAAGEHQQTREILAAVADALGVGGDGERSIGETLAVLRRYAQSVQADSQVAVLVIDDAHLLGEEAAAALVSLLQGGGDSVFGLHLVLWSRPGMVARLDALQLVDIPIHDFAIPAIGPDDVEDYLAFLAEQDSGWVAKVSQFSPEEVAASGGGTIGGVNRYLSSSSAIAAAPAESLEPLEDQQAEAESNAGARSFVIAGLPVTHFAVLGVLVAVLSWALLAWESEPDSAVEGRVANPVALPDPMQLNSGENGQISAEAAGTVAATDAAPAADTQQVVMSSEASAMAIPGANGEAVVGDLEPVVDERELHDAIYNPPALTSRQESAQKAPDAGQAASDAAASDTALQRESQPKSQPKQQPQPQPGSQPVSMSAPASGDVEQLLAFAADTFSLQVMAAGSRESVEAFRRQQPNRTELYLYRTQRNGRDWFVLLAGHYPSHEAASQAIANLPKNQRSAGPWPRKLDSVQAEISELRGR